MSTKPQIPICRSVGSVHHIASPGGKLSKSQILTDEECGRKTENIALYQAFSCLTGFAVPHPTSHALGHLPPGGRYLNCAINWNLQLYRNYRAGVGCFFGNLGV